MNINRNNFEELCLLYLDGELSQAERQELEAFVAANPDLAVELDLLQQLKLKPETESPVLFDKTSLFRSSAMENEAIHSGNYETYFLLYTDDELDPEGRKSVEKFVMDHPKFQKEFNLLQASRLVAEPVAFPDKSLLYRKTTQPARITVMRYWRVAAAAAVILGGIWLGMNTQQHSNVDSRVASAQTDKAKKNEAAKENKAPEKNQNEVARVNTDKSSEENAEVNESVKQAPAPILAANKNRTVKSDVKSRQQETKVEQKDAIEEPAVAMNEHRTNDLPTERTTVVSDPVSPSSTETATNLDTRTPEVDVIDRPKGGPNAENAKNNFASEALLSASESNVYVVNASQVEDDHKSPLRGVFRKASRLLNKVTNPEIFKPTSKQNK